LRATGLPSGLTRGNGAADAVGAGRACVPVGRAQFRTRAAGASGRGGSAPPAGGRDLQGLDDLVQTPSARRDKRLIVGMEDRVEAVGAEARMSAESPVVEDGQLEPVVAVATLGHTIRVLGTAEPDVAMAAVAQRLEVGRTAAALRLQTKLFQGSKSVTAAGPLSRRHLRAAPALRRATPRARPACSSRSDNAGAEADIPRLEEFSRRAKCSISRSPQPAKPRLLESRRGGRVR
jgi:hypothetical protein